MKRARFGQYPLPRGARNNVSANKNACLFIKIQFICSILIYDLDYLTVNTPHKSKSR